MDKIQEKWNALFAEGESLINDRENIEIQISKINRRLIEIEGALKVLDQLKIEMEPQPL
jgi:chaperonin cofactor prefoldin